ncbi:hypothetical protein Vadar_006713 [Vaccinium darrowii]|uniref:Uncharacterized protein n=1 Tax=Vaccinium darrowii TaxID=229202 RepID=A0ACB7X7X4_9ERIC|nr:hypothetical protein Vadar_006713 [Vaccinium darrowii]
MVLVSNLLFFRKRWHVHNNIVYMHEVEARSLFIAFHLEVLAFGAHVMHFQMVTLYSPPYMLDLIIHAMFQGKISSCKLSIFGGLTDNLWISTLTNMQRNTAGGNLIPHVLKVQVGEDIVGKLLSVVHMGPQAVCIFSAAGFVAIANIRTPGCLGSGVLRCQVL